MSDIEQRLREAEALNLLTNRILMDYLSLQIDGGQASVEGVKRLVAFSANEVIRGAPNLEVEARYFEKVLSARFDETFTNQK
jgi:hypothetical protein